MGIKERKARQKAELKQKIMNAAAHIIINEGAAALTIRRIAKQIEYSPRTVYLYFENKDALMQELIEYGFGRSVAIYTDLEPQSTADIRQHIQQQIRMNIQMAQDNKHYYKAVTTLILSKGYEPGPNQRKLMAFVKNDFTAYYNSIQRRVGDLDARMFLLFSMIRGFNLSLINADEQLTSEQKQELIERFVLAAMQGVVDS